jgi:biotin-dependent carboxylase-like uncharacterized protein
MASLTIIRPGLLTTVQDHGRWGRQGSGVPVAGPMDPYSHRLANGLVGNEESAAALEVTLIGPELEADADLLCAVAGARFRVTVNGRDVAMHRPFEVPAGARLRFGERSAGARASLAVQGGLDVETRFGSRATSLISQMGPFGGRALAAGDVLPVGSPRGLSPKRAGDDRVVPLELPSGGASLRVLRGPHESRFTARAFETLFAGRYVVTPHSNRMGYRLDGPPLEHAGGADVLSDATPIGSLQVPASGQPILLMADRQTTGGYPRIATVISADIPLAGQLAPGDWIAFALGDRAEAIDALREQRARVEGRGR